MGFLSLFIVASRNILFRWMLNSAPAPPAVHSRLIVKGIARPMRTSRSPSIPAKIGLIPFLYYSMIQWFNDTPLTQNPQPYTVTGDPYSSPHTVLGKVSARLRWNKDKLCRYLHAHLNLLSQIAAHESNKRTIDVRRLQTTMLVMLLHLYPLEACVPSLGRLLTKLSVVKETYEASL